jgi:hypothetical protein
MNLTVMEKDVVRLLRLMKSWLNICNRLETTLANQSL